jgi:hypothetical protein
MEKTIYTGKWALDSARNLSRDLFRSALFAMLLLIGFLGFYLLAVASEDESSLSSNPSAVLELGVFVLVAFIVLVVCCYIALFIIADDRRWGIQPDQLPRVWDDQEARWITSTVSFAHYLQERGSHIESTLVRYDDPRTAAHRMIDKVDERTLQLYLSLLSVVQLEQERIKVEVTVVKPKALKSQTPQA